MKKRETNRDKSKRKTQQPYIIKEMNLEINYQNSPEINNNIKNSNNSTDTFTLNNISKNNSKRNKKLKSYFYKKDSKRTLNEIPANSNEELDKNILSSPSIQTHMKEMKINLTTKNENDINIEEYLSTEPEDMDYDDVIKRDKRTFCQYFMIN